MDRARGPGAARVARRGRGGLLTLRGGLGRGLVALASLFACKLDPDPDQVVAIEIILPDSARTEVTDSYLPHARALNGAGDSVAAPLFWSSLDTAVIEVLDSATGVSLAKTIGTGRLQARVEALRSTPQPVTVLAHLDTLFANTDTLDTVVAPDSLSDSLAVRALATGGDPIGRRAVYALTIFPAGAATITVLPNDTVSTNSLGIASVQVKFTAGTLPDSVVVLATMRRPDGTPIAGSPVKFVVGFQP